jgi:hypothetical protein
MVAVIERIPLVRLQNGKMVWLDGASVTQEEGLEIAKKLFDTFGLQGPRISRKLMYEITPHIWRDCSHTESLEEARRMAQEEDEMAKKYPNWPF